MASNTMATWHKRTRAHSNMGRKRKNAEARHSTPSYEQLFAGMGEPGKPATQPAAASRSSKTK
jgi:hypothetical protein